VSSSSRQRRRTPRLGDKGAPVTTLALLVAAAVAVIAGFVVLRSMTDQADGSESIVGSDDAASDDATATVTSAPTSAAARPLSTTTTTSSTTSTTVASSAAKSDAIVVVANASGVDRSATAMIAELEAAGYTTAPVANTTGPRLERSVIYYLEEDPASLAVARLLAGQIPTAQTLAMPEPPPLDRPLDGATVALLLGRDAAGRSLAELQND
jgi:cytoskeletal protein RodZ